MNEPKGRRPYRLAHVKKCFGQTSDALILQWYNRGIISAGLIPKGSMTQFAFSFAEIVHIGAIYEMMSGGLIKKSDYIMIVLDLHDDPEKLVPLGMQHHNALIEVYQTFDYDLCYVFDSFYIDIATASKSKRNKTKKCFNLGMLTDPAWAAYSCVADLASLALPGRVGVDTELTNSLIELIDPYSRDILVKDRRSIGIGERLSFAVDSHRTTVINLSKLTARVADSLAVPNPWRHHEVISDLSKLKLAAVFMKALKYFEEAD